MKVQLQNQLYFSVVHNVTSKSNKYIYKNETKQKVAKQTKVIII